MSGINGEKSRFHRLRKQKIQRRIRNRVMDAQINLSQSEGSSSKPSATASSAGKRNDAARE